MGSDGYVFDRKEYENTTPGVKFVLIQSSSEMAKIKKKFFGPNWKNVSAFTEWDPVNGVCTIYVMDPSTSYKPELIGHEVAHCIWGRWHDKPSEPVSP